MNTFRTIVLLAGFFVAAFFCLAVSCLIEVRREWRRRVLLCCGCYGLIFMIIFTGDLYNLPPTLLFFLFCVWNACSGSGLKRLTIGLMLASTMFAWNALLDNCVSVFLYHDGFTARFGFRTLAVLLLYAGIRRHRPERDFELAPSLWRLLLMLCMPPLGIVCSLVLLSNPYDVSERYIPMYSALLLVAVFSLAGILRAMLVLDRQQRLERENALAEHNRKYYEAMEQQQFEIRRIRHDLANHLQALLSLPAEEKDDYILKMMENPAFEKVLSYSGDATVNAVLTAKENMMRQRGISFCAKVDIPDALPFDKPDLCALFANALDNAAEACAPLDAGKRKIALNARAAKGILAIEVKNPYDGKQKGGGGQLPETTKADARNHGFGLRSIQETVKKYGGNMELKQEDGWFVLFCCIPVPGGGTRQSGGA